MPTRRDDQQPSHHPGTIAQEGSRDATPLSVSTPLTLPNESEVVYELRDDDFILVDPDETIEFQTAQHLLRRAPPPPPELPPLPAWAAASRSVLDGWNGESSQAAIELREAREDLIRFARQTYAREVYVEEVERALAAAQGRVRGQAFRIAELEQALRASEAEALRVARQPLSADSPQPSSRLELRAADAESLRAMLELDLRALQAETTHAPSVLHLGSGVLQPSAADDGARGSALVSLREYVARVQPGFAHGASFAPGQYVVEAQTRRRAAPKRRSARKPARRRDDLQRIKGVGPSMAERLAKAGVKSFESIGRWKAKDLERMADELGVSRGRIERQAWVKQARALAKKR